MAASPVAITAFGTSGGVVQFTIYKVDVNLGGDSWSVWRRFKQFKELNDMIGEFVHIGGNEKDSGNWFGEGNASQLFPPKVYPNGDSVIRQRMVTLNAWLNKVMAFRPSANLKQRVETGLNGFFDVLHKGQSGLASAAGNDRGKELVRETFLRVKLTNSLMYGIYYVGLTRDNMIYICKKIYDPPRDSVFACKLDATGGRINTFMKGDCGFNLQGADNDVHFEFSTREETAEWFRAISAACQPAPLEKITPEKRREMHMEEQRRKQEEKERAKEDMQRSQGKEDVFIGSTGGNAADLLSASHGI